jgi:pilus assembly protein CpaB
LKIQRPKIKINKTWLMLAVAIVLSLLTTWLTLQYLKSKEKSIEEEVTARTEQGRGTMVSVVVPTKNYPVGTILDESMVASRSVPADFVFDEAVRPEQFDAFKGQALLRPVMRGKPLRRADVQPVFADFADTLKAGKRAMTINVDEINSVSHMIEPGNLVDLMLLLPGAEGGGSPGAGAGTPAGQTVVPFLDQVKVLATGQKITHDDPAEGPEKRKVSYSNLTLEVTPAQAARLALATELGKIRAVLRNQKDTEAVDYDSINTANLLEDVRERAKLAALARPKKVEAPGAPVVRTPSTYVQYIIGGKGGGSDATTPTTNVAIPGAAAAAEAQANIAALSGQLPDNINQLLKAAGQPAATSSQPAAKSSK